MSMINVGIIGGTGYTGAELLRLLAGHDHCQVAIVASRSEAGRPVADLYPNLRGHSDVSFVDPTTASFKECDVVFCATPNGIAMQHAPELLAAGIKFIDLAADFRLHDAELWSKWYGQSHACPDLLKDAVYGLPELYRAEIKEANLVANPGCYPTATTLGFLPLLLSDFVDPSSLMSDAKSGVSGAGRGASVSNLFSEVSDSFKAYGVAAHRHHPEITQTLQQLTNDPVSLTFVPHLLPILRGIHATLYADLRPKITLTQVHAAFEEKYRDEPFVDVLPLGSSVETRSVKGSNMCRLAVHQATGSNKLVILSVIDNLTKGAAGQAIQNMNIMFGLDEQAGLGGIGLMP